MNDHDYWRWNDSDYPCDLFIRFIEDEWSWLLEMKWFRLSMWFIENEWWKLSMRFIEDERWKMKDEIYSQDLLKMNDSDYP
jgi:hypothetical protein